MNFTGKNNSRLIYNPYQDSFRIVKITTLITLSVSGIIGNTFVIILVAKFTVRKNLHHLIINMCVADIVVVFISGLPGLTVYWDYDFWIFSNKWNDITCKCLSFLRLAVAFISLNTLLIISIERCRATRLTVQRPQPYTFLKRLIGLILSWVVAFGVASYAFLLFKVVPGSKGVLRCLPFLDGNNVLWLLVGKMIIII